MFQEFQGQEQKGRHGILFCSAFLFRRLFRPPLLGRDGVEGLLEVGDEVFGVLQPHAEAQESLADVRGVVQHAKLGVVAFPLVELHQALGVAEADRGPARSYFTGRM